MVVEGMVASQAVLVVVIVQSQADSVLVVVGVGTVVPQVAVVVLGW